MLKYKILNNNNTSELVNIDYENYELNEDKSVISFNLVKNNVVHDNDTITMTSIVIIENIANGVNNVANFDLATEAIMVDNKLSLNIPTKFSLEPESLIYDDTDASDSYILTFTTPHFFSYNDSKDDMFIYISNYVITNSDNTPRYFKIYFEYVSINSIKFSANQELIANYRDTFVNSFKSFDYYREDFRFTNPSILKISKRNSILSIPLEIVNNFQTDLFKEELLTTNFVEKEKKKTINRIINMEKQVYYPVYNDGGDRGFIDELFFNLHFRERQGDNWLVDNNRFWNGTKYPNNWSPINPLTKPTIENCTQNQMAFFDVDKQSDLLSYLDFTNNDIRYQKSKLKKSFLRLLFYDSTNQTNQNLLYTSTVFIDSGKLFGKYCRYAEDEPYIYSKDDVIENGVGIKVDREPSCELLKKYDSTITSCCNNKSDNIRNDLRLSTQFVIKDKYNKQASSEGFYLYLFSEDDLKLVEKDIYMKIEFNHAGYGRTLPFMSPTDENGRFLSYQEIINEWYKNLNSDKNEVVGFSIRKYYSYTYIKLKVVYDKKLKKHVYYLDNQENVDKINRTMTINLYEAKVG